MIPLLFKLPDMLHPLDIPQHELGPAIAAHMQEHGSEPKRIDIGVASQDVVNTYGNRQYYYAYDMRTYSVHIVYLGRDGDTGGRCLQHEFLDLGFRRTWCRKCNADGEWTGGRAQLAN